MKNSQVSELITSLDNNLLQINYFLKQQSPRHFDLIKSYLYNQNWSLLIGAAKSGKTSLLQQADVNLMQCQTINNTPCNTWFNQHAVFIEIPELEKSGELASALIHNIQQLRRNQPFDSIILTLNIYDYLTLSQNDLNAHSQQLANNLTQLLKPHLRHEIQLYITVTHLDRIAGFSAFFAEFSKKERQQVWGYQLDNYATTKTLLEQQHEKYNLLLRNMHEHLIRRLHKTRNSLTSYLIREFPLQIESLQHIIKTIVAHLAEIEPQLCKIKGVFFTSARQNGACHDRITASIIKSHDLALNADFQQASRDQAFFIDGMLQLIIDNYRRNPAYTTSWIKHVTYITTTVAALMLGAIVLNYHCTALSLDKLHTALAKFQHMQQLAATSDADPLPNILTTTLTTIVPPLQQLAAANDALNNNHPYLTLPFSKLNHILTQINYSLHSTLSDALLPQFTHYIEQVLVNSKDPAQQYAALKIYLMLGEPQFMQMAYLKTWLQQHWHDSKNFTAGMQLLQITVAPPYKGIKLQPELIKNARNYLNNLPPSYLAYVLIKQRLAGADIAIKHASGILQHTRIPYLYTRIGFISYMKNIMPQQLRQLQQEGWVLKRHTQRSIITQLRQLYFADYTNWWRLFTLHMQPTAFNNIADASKYFKQLTVDATSLDEIVNVIQNNTRAFKHPDNIQKLFNQQIAVNFTNINLVNNNNLHNLTPILTNLNQYFNTIATAANQDAVCFDIAKARFLNPLHPDPLNDLLNLAQQAPEPVNHWIKSVAMNSWILILQHAQSYINQQWHSNLYAEYKQRIADRYPIVAVSDIDIDLDDFQHFFADNGTLQQFFNNYLQPFINTQQSQWQPKEVAGISLPFAPQTILELERANVIRQMFFASNATALSVNFSLQPIAFQAAVNRLTLDINGQQHAGDRGTAKISRFNWPGDYQTTPTILSIQIITGQKYQLSESGAWGLFKLLSHAKVTPSGNDTQHFQIIFDLNGNAAKYLLTAANPVNPFVPEVIQQFNLPERII